MNFIQIAGHLGADPETRFTSSGLKVTTLRVATNSRKAGKDETIWWKVTIWGDRFDKMLPYLKKGSAIIVWGEMGKPEIYTDKEGRPQVSLDITAELIRFSPFGKPDRAEQPGGNQYNQAGGNQYNQGQGYSSSNPQQDQGFTEQSYGTQAGFNQGSAPNYGGAQKFATSHGTQAQDSFSEEEPIPF